MGTWDSADLLLRLRDLTGRPATDSVLTDDRGYRYLSDAQRDIADVMSQHAPWLNYGAPEQLTTSDNKVYTLATSGEEWIGRVEVYRSLNGELMIEGPYWDQGADYTVEGANSIRITGDRTHSGDAPYVRFMARPTEITASVQPVLVPTSILEAVVARAAAIWARRGGFKDPSPYEQEVERVLWGSGTNYGGGILGAAKQQQGGYAPSGIWWRGITTG